tara:strand:+ start:9376 stop:9960 length:585 start_codon:yes stop_codon:yes gene_type:complete
LYTVLTFTDITGVCGAGVTSLFEWFGRALLIVDQPIAVVVFSVADLWLTESRADTYTPLSFRRTALDSALTDPIAGFPVRTLKRIAWPTRLVFTKGTFTGLVDLSVTIIIQTIVADLFGGTDRLLAAAPLSLCTELFSCTAKSLATVRSCGCGASSCGGGVTLFKELLGGSFYVVDFPVTVIVESITKLWGGLL